MKNDIFYTELRAVGACGGIKRYRGQSIGQAILAADPDHLHWMLNKLGWNTFFEPQSGETNSMIDERLRMFFLHRTSTLTNLFKKMRATRLQIARLKKQLAAARARR